MILQGKIQTKSDGLYCLTNIDGESGGEGHKYEGETTEEPTCTTTGIKIFTCHCGDSYTEIIKVNGHSKGEQEYIGGKEYAKNCTVCGDKLESKIVTVNMTFNGNIVANDIGKATITVTINGTVISDSVNTTCPGYKIIGWDSEVPSTMTAENLSFTAKFELSFKMSIRNPSKTTISYGDSIILHADMNEALPSGWKIKWTADNGNISYSANGETYTISPNKSGDTTFTVSVVDANGNVISSDEQTMTSKAGFFDKIIAFFKKLFGLTKTIPQIYKGIF